MLFAFDMDGTILDSMPGLTDLAVDLIVRRYRVPKEYALEAYKKTVGLPFIKQLDLMFPTSGLLNGEVANEYEDEHFRLATTFKLGPNIERMLERIALAGHRSALVTSTDVETVIHTSQVALLPFDFIGGYMPGFPKFKQLIKAMQRTGENTAILFGDADSDEKCAKLVGCRFKKVTIDSTADDVLDVLEELSETVHDMR